MAPMLCVCLVMFCLGGYYAAAWDVIDSVWLPGPMQIKNLTRAHPESIDSFMDTAFDEPINAHVDRKIIGLESVGGRFNSSDAVWKFKSVIVIPPLSCGLIGNVASLFDSALKLANPGHDNVSSTAQRLGASPCVDGICPCAADHETKYTTSVLEIATLCDTNRIALPSLDDFPFVFDARTDTPPLFVKRKGRIIVFDES
jgi:hypothetical protein